jgi:ABC-type protease/lipase transport system fused ATPase/permease subunit
MASSNGTGLESRDINWMILFFDYCFDSHFHHCFHYYCCIALLMSSTSCNQIRCRSFYNVYSQFHSFFLFFFFFVFWLFLTER